MESMVSPFWKGKKVLITGNTGFKGAWLSLWLHEMGASVSGFSDQYPTDPCLSKQAQLSALFPVFFNDIRDRVALGEVINKVRPEIVFHMAAQPLVRLSYKVPVETYEVNVMGTVNILDLCRHSDSVRTVVNITSDKCYENFENNRPFMEEDPMGGHDPYSSSKGCAELVTSAYGRSFFALAGKSLISCRAGNVIGGGDWALDRLVPDIFRAYSNGELLSIRSPESVRPWQHVLEPLSGYIRAAEKSFGASSAQVDAYNFGPSSAGIATVREIVEEAKVILGNGLVVEYGRDNASLHEAKLLMLDSSKAARELGWGPVWSIREMLEKTFEIYRHAGDSSSLRKLMSNQIRHYVKGSAS